MKVLKEGKPWWHGLKASCECGREVELEIGDQNKREWSMAPNSQVRFHCGCCGRIVTVTREVPSPSAVGKL